MLIPACSIEHRILQLRLFLVPRSPTDICHIGTQARRSHTLRRENMDWTGTKTQHHNSLMPRCLFANVNTVQYLIYVIAANPIPRISLRTGSALVPSRWRGNAHVLAETRSRWTGRRYLVLARAWRWSWVGWSSIGTCGQYLTTSIEWGQEYVFLWEGN